MKFLICFLMIFSSVMAFADCPNIQVGAYNCENNSTGEKVIIDIRVQRLDATRFMIDLISRDPSQALSSFYCDNTVTSDGLCTADVRKNPVAEKTCEQDFGTDREEVLTITRTSLENSMTEKSIDQIQTLDGATVYSTTIQDHELSLTNKTTLWYTISHIETGLQNISTQGSYSCELML